MSSGFEAAINEMMAEIEKQKEEMNRLQQRMNDVTGKATSTKKQLSVVVDARGELTELKFHGQSYRNMAATELSAMIMETIAKARQAAQAQVWQQNGVPQTGPMADLVSGRGDWSAALDDALNLPQPFLDLLSRGPTDLLDGVDIGPLMDQAATAAEPGPQNKNGKSAHPGRG